VEEPGLSRRALDPSYILSGLCTSDAKQNAF
jgi:hypothetical protein